MTHLRPLVAAVVCLAALPAGAFAQGLMVGGRVHDPRSNGSGVQNATVMLVGWGATLSNAAGEFSFRRLARLDDEAAIEALDALPGIGRWSAEMYLIFALNRLDIFAMDDVGLRRGVNRLYGNGRKLSDRRTLAITKAWAPYRSVASWYLWRLGNEEPANWA